MSTWPRQRVMIFLAAVSVAGLLSMHGLDSVVTTVHPAHSTHSADTEGELDDHGAIGLCVFVAAFVTLGMASIRRLLSSETLVGLIYRPGRPTRRNPRTPFGPSLLFRLGVLRF